jgi:hypothetical protein
LLINAIIRYNALFFQPQINVGTQYSKTDPEMRLKIILFFIFLSTIATAQQFTIDLYGHITDSAAASNFFKNRYYNLVSDFVAVDQNNNSIKWAKVTKYDSEGYIDLQGNEVIKPRFQTVSEFRNGVAVVTYRGKALDLCGTVYDWKCGLLNIKDSLIVDGFDGLSFLDDGVYVAKKNNEYSFINQDGKKIANVNSSGFMRLSDGLIAGVHNGKYALFKPDGTQLSDYLYTAIGTVGKFVVANIGGGIYFINPATGQPSYDKFWDFSSNKFINESDLLIVNLDRDYFLVDKFYKKIAGPFESITQISPDYFIVFKDAKSSVANTRGKLLLPFDHYVTTATEEKFIEAGKGNITKFFHKHNDPKYLRNLLKAKRDGGKEGFADAWDNWVIPAMYDQSYDARFIDGRAYVCKEKKCGFIDRGNKVVIPLLYDYLVQCPEGYIGNMGNACGVIDPNGKVLIPFVYESIDRHPRGYFIVKKEGKSGIIDIKSKILMPFVYKVIKPIHEDLVIVSDIEGTKFGIANLSGQLLAPMKYTYIEHENQYTQLPKGLFFGTIGEKSVVFDKYGNDNADR